MIQAPQGDGRPCPSQMEQWKPCLVKPCFSWRYSAWSECKSEVSQPPSCCLSENCIHFEMFHYNIGKDIYFFSLSASVFRIVEVIQHEKQHLKPLCVEFDRKL